MLATSAGGLPELYAFDSGATGLRLSQAALPSGYSFGHGYAFEEVFPLQVFSCIFLKNMLK